MDTSLRPWVKTVTIRLSDEEHKQLHELALLQKTSVSVLCRYALTGMLKRARWGWKPRIASASLDTAILTTGRGTELTDEYIRELLRKEDEEIAGKA